MEYITSITNEHSYAFQKIAVLQKFTKKNLEGYRLILICPLILRL